MEIWSRPTRAKQQNGAWAWIDTDLVHRDGFLRPKLSKQDVAFSTGGAGTPLVTLRIDSERSLSLLWPTPLPAPVVSGSQATYSNAVATGADLVVSALPEGFRYDFVYRSQPETSAEMSLLAQAKGLKLLQDSKGRIRITDLNDQRVAVNFTATMGHAGPAKPSDITLKKTGDTQQLVIKPDHELLARAGTKSPLRVTSALVAGAVTDVDVADDGSPTDPTLPFLTAGTIFGISSRTYLRFDANEVFSHGEVPILNATVSGLNVDAPYCGDAVGAGIQARRVTSAWDPDTLTWDTKPTTTAEGATTVTKGYSSECGEGILEWPVSDMVRAWLKGAPYHGVELRAPSEGGDDNWRSLASAEHPTASTPPKLTIEFDGNAIPSALSASVSDARLTPEELAGQTFTYQSLYDRPGFCREDLDELARTNTLSDTGFPKPDWDTGEEWPFPEDPDADPPYWRPQPGEPTGDVQSPQPSPSSSTTADDRDTVLTIWKERDGKRVYYRKGFYNSTLDDGFGDTKVRLKHNLSQRAVAATTIYPRPNSGKTQQLGNAMRWNYVTDVHLKSCEGFWLWQDCGDTWRSEGSGHMTTATA
ncbi:DNRLRE domain-containing protein [Nonomuraea mesophila]|uniref:DNRLRE domain-containing protein n=1 Tax=Nonomuraea mesophila TaxID=2530382 RepID=A0A4R5EAE5_9ACTN|nr:DNRLRE domain-containing protein [Nonomuraea mesophila]TDE29543.1 DNRLRE domain-containing protein [Nonomuraea mesophila]